MGILDVIAKETNGIRQYSDQYQIRSNGSHTVHRAQERPFTPEQCPPVSAADSLMLNALFNYAEKRGGDEPALCAFCRFAYDRFAPKEIFGYLFWQRAMQDDAVQLMAIQILNNLMLDDCD